MSNSAVELGCAGLGFCPVFWLSRYSNMRIHGCVDSAA
jgi:hypothetical protein